MSFYYSPWFIHSSNFYVFVHVTIIWLQSTRLVGHPDPAPQKHLFMQISIKYTNKKIRYEGRKGIKVNYSTTLHWYSKLFVKLLSKDIKIGSFWKMIQFEQPFCVSVPGPALGQMGELLPSICCNAVDPTITCNGRTLNNGGLGDKKITILFIQITLRECLFRQ